ncbi:XK-related protein 8 [Dendropsophus ebraccatus]|uniref:XK-related protein 8 n=1 Tax=Dendropsophus ebraccatus TaxID=150705 RepID=UPI0038312D13
MQRCLPARYRLLDLGFALFGTVAFLVDLGSDVWSSVRYYKAGHTAWAALYLGLYVLSSPVLQLLSWGWFWVDWQDLSLQQPYTDTTDAVKQGAPGDAAHTIQVSSNGDTRHSNENGAKYPRDASVVDAVPTEENALDPCHLPVIHAEEHGPPEKAKTHGETPPQEDHIETVPMELPSAEDELFVRSFCTSKIILWPSCFTLLHVLQLGYLLRCIHSLEVGFTAYRKPEEDWYNEYAYFLTHDISFMRLVETFLENTPQLILVLYIIIQTEVIQAFQCFSISVSFICISWAILDYHQSLRMFLRGKRKLNTISSAIYYLWNFCLISARILCITLFTVTFHWRIALHFLLLWLALFLWVSLQKTSFMKHKYLEIGYRATVATILYFSWFNIADGKTVYRSIVYHVFITIDSVILVVSWVYFKFPSILDEYETSIIVTSVVFFAVGLFLRSLYYKYLHPNVSHEEKQYFDVPDGIQGVETNRFQITEGKSKLQSDRMAYLAGHMY